MLSFLENSLQLMAAASNLLLLISVLRWAQLAVFNNSNVTNRPITQSQPAPVPLFDNNSLPSPYFEDVYDGEIQKLSYRLNRTESAVVLFYAPWSRSSLHFKPIFERLAAKHARHNFEFIAINCWQPGTSTCRQAFSLKGGYPYISFFTHNTGHVFYNGVLSESEIVFFIYKFTFPFHTAADNRTLAGLRLLSPSKILIVILVENNSTIPTSVDSPHHFVSQSLKVDPRKSGMAISAELYKIGMRSVVVGVISVFVPRSLFPNFRPMVPYFFTPTLHLSAVPQNWTGWLPPLKEKPIKLDQTKTNVTTTTEETGTFVDRGVDRAVVAVVNSFLPSTGPQFCNPGVAMLKTASRLYGECVSSNSSDLLSHVTISLAIEERQCQQLRLLSREPEEMPPVEFKMLQDGGENLAKLSEIAGLGCGTGEEVGQRFSFQIEPLQTTFAAVERRAGVGVIFNNSAPSSNIGPRKPLQVMPGIYLLDGRQERPARIIDTSSFSEDDAVERLIGWLKEQDRIGGTDGHASGTIRLPKWLPETSIPTLVYYEAPWCVFCSILTPRILLAVRAIRRNVASFRLVRVTDAEQVAEPTLYDGSQDSSIASNVFSVHHYPSLVFYPQGTLHSVSFNIPHSPGSKIVPVIWHHMPLTDKLLSCTAGSELCRRRQLANVRSLQRRLWQRQDELFYIDDDMNILTNCKHKHLQLARFVSRLQVIFSQFPSFGAYRLIASELTRFNALRKSNDYAISCF